MCQFRIAKKKKHIPNTADCAAGTISRLGGVTFQELAQETWQRHQLAYQERPCDTLVLRDPGAYHWRHGGEKHVNDPVSVANLQQAARSNSVDAFARFQVRTLETDTRPLIGRGKRQQSAPIGSPIVVL